MVREKNGIKLAVNFDNNLDTNIKLKESKKRL